ncbi:MAG: KTSC domain-containing protein [Flavobacteriaceae bacterium]
MKRVGEYRKLLGVTANVTLKELKLVYRNQIKATHPDKFVDDEEGRILAEENSKVVIEAYHFLTSISPETHEANSEEFMNTITSSGIKDFYFEKRVLYINHENGINYEYLGVPQSTFVKMINSDSVSLFANRHIYGKFLFRKSSNATDVTS